MDNSRRNVIRLGALMFLSSTAFAAGVEKKVAQDLVSVFVDQSGTEAQGDWVMGVLLVKSPKAQGAVIRAARARTNFRRDIKFQRCDRRRIPFVETLFPAVVADQSLLFWPFHVRPVQETASMERQLAGHLRRMLHAFGASGAREFVMRASKSDVVAAYLREEFPTASHSVSTSALKRHSDHDDLLGLTDLLTGSARRLLKLETSQPKPNTKDLIARKLMSTIQTKGNDARVRLIER
ncbi:hypothetical protein [Peristeroidobacter soli]|uniref:hypothetical protein n=1 Tax=Peristeroidobacter soli TaxID=2497877 RepID=UPI00101BD892|nr:hypothetical protein [Peristeroidobacter soli]